MRVNKRLALLLGFIVGINVISPGSYTLANETDYRIGGSLFVVEDNGRTTESQIEVEASTTTTSSSLIVWNTKFDKNELIQQGNQVKLQIENGTIQSIMQGETTLVPQRDYSMRDNVITIEKAYLIMLPTGQYTLNFQVMNNQNQEDYVLMQEIQCIDTTDIYMLIEQAEQLASEVTIGTDIGDFNLRDQLILKMAIACAREELEEVRYQEQIDEIYRELEQSIVIFRNSMICDESELDKIGIRQLIQQAEELYSAVKVGNEPGMCYESSRIALQIAIIDCKKIEESANNQNSLNKALEDLKFAVVLFETSIIPFQNEDINHDGKVDVQDLALVMYYYRTEEKDESWEIGKNADVNKDGVVDLVDLVEVAHKVLGK